MFDSQNVIYDVCSKQRQKILWFDLCKTQTPLRQSQKKAPIRLRTEV